MSPADLRAVLISGDGPRAFCSGADINEFRPQSSAVELRDARQGFDVFAELAECPAPTVAQLHGYVLGGGLELALCCDIRVASDDAVFGFPETGLGTFPGSGSTQRLPRAVGMGMASLMIFAGLRLRAEDALRCGLVEKVVPRDDLEGASDEIVRAIARNAPLGVRYAKEAMLRGQDVPLSAGLRIERDLNSYMDTTMDYREAAEAFVARRDATFLGR